MMKKILGIIFFSLMLNGNVLSEEIIINCKNAKYKYVNDGTNVLAYSTNIKRDKGNVLDGMKSGCGDGQRRCPPREALTNGQEQRKVETDNACHVNDFADFFQWISQNLDQQQCQWRS